jgi:type IV fimbrial biogenesis protein FimT
VLTPVKRRAYHGFTIIELVVTLALFGVLMGLAVPSFTIFIQNTQIRNAAETVLTGLTQAKSEAIRRNTPVRFQFVTTLTSSCALSQSSGSWIVSLDDPAGACEVAPSETTTPRTYRKQSSADGYPKVTVTATSSSSIVFNGIGRIVGTGITQIDFTHNAMTCEHLDTTNGTARCLRILISTGGAPKLCDPKVTATTDSRHCS